MINEESDETRASRANDLTARSFKQMERVLLLLIALMTLAATAIELFVVFEKRTVDLADILLMFLYLEVIGMISVYYEGRESPFVYPIFIAITALARLIVLQGKDMAPENIVFEAGAVLLLAIASVIVVQAGRRRSHARAERAEEGS